MTPFLGMRLVANPLLVERKTVRIRGGYLNRWLIRAEVDVPSTKIFQSLVDGVYYCHPDVLDRIKNECGPVGTTPHGRTVIAPVLEKLQYILGVEERPYRQDVVQMFERINDGIEPIRLLQDTGKKTAQWKTDRRGRK